jgi:hypothetical protein
MSVVNVGYLQHAQQADWTYNSAVSSGLLCNHAAVAALCLIKYHLCPDPQQLTLIWEFAYQQWWHYVFSCSVCVLNKRHVDLKTVCSCDDVVPFSVWQALQVLPFCCYLILGGAVQMSALRSVCCLGHNTIITIIHCHIVNFPCLSYWRHRTMEFTGDLTWHYYHL